MRMSVAIITILQIELDRDDCSTPQSGINYQLSIKDACPFSDADEAEAASLGFFANTNRFGCKSLPVILNRNLHTARISFDPNLRFGRLRMLDDVVNALLHHAVEVDLKLFREEIINRIE